MDDPIAIKGIREGLLLTIRPDGGEWMELTSLLTARLDQQLSFFRGARVALDVGSRPVRPHEMDSLKIQLDRRDMTLWAVISDSATTHATAANLSLETSLVPQQEQMETREVDSEEQGRPGVLIDRTLRNGRTVRTDASVIVVGDVNPGAEIISGGDVIVWGKLRGRVHAGANGDDKAIICALDLAPTQLRIANLISMAIEDKRRKPRPEVASIRQGRIIAEPWNG
jgi:septum site-determining protein MinC